jgi:hypothetical protein
MIFVISYIEIMTNSAGKQIYARSQMIVVDDSFGNFLVDGDEQGTRRVLPGHILWE